MPQQIKQITHRESLPLLSVIVPCYMEEAVLNETHKSLLQTLSSLQGMTAELIFIDDGSTDRTMPLLREIQRTDERVRVISLSRNFGHQIALSAGLECCRGDAVVIIDADLQDPPEVIFKMLECWRNGADVAYGVRVERQGESRFKLYTAKLFYRIINRMSDTVIPLDTGDFRLMSRRAVDALLAMPEKDRFVRGMVAWLGFRQEAVKYQRAPRFAGETKYPLRKMLRFAADGILSFSTVPLKITSWLGFIASLFALIGIIYALVTRLLTDIWVPGWTLLMIAVLFLGGVQLISLGVVGEYLGRVYGEVKRRPLYLIKESLGFNTENTEADKTRWQRGK